MKEPNREPAPSTRTTGELGVTNDRSGTRPAGVGPPFRVSWITRRSATMAPVEVEVRAAGGVVVRDHGGDLEVLVVHRPHYDDWSFPKGKCDDGESDEAAALREVAEETGFTCRMLEELPSAHYTDRKGRAKQVRYWRMVALETPPFTANDEVDELRWCSVRDAAKLLTYPMDRSLLNLVGMPS